MAEDNSSDLLLSIVIVNSNGNQDTLNCLASIYNHLPHASVEVICVDNCSTVQFLPVMLKEYPQVQGVMAPERQGFAKNYNLGIRQAHGEYVMILNNDTLIHPCALDNLLQAIQVNPTYGMVGPCILSTKGQVQTVCARSLYTPFYYILVQFLFDLALPTGQLWDRYQRKRLTHLPSGPVPCISGACMLVSRAALNRVGILDEGYDFYYEDVEWCHRFQKNGYQVAYIAEAQITHLGDQALSKVKEWAKQSEYRSALRYFRQYHRLSMVGAWVLWVATVMGFLCRAIIFTLAEKLSGNTSHAQAYRNLSRWILLHPPGEENMS